MQTVKSKDGQVLTEIEDAKRRWKESYEELYNNQNPINKDATEGIAQMSNMEEELEILKEEVISAIKKMERPQATIV